MELTFEYPAWFIVLCLAFGGLGAFLLYYGNNEFKALGIKFRKWIWFMASLRFLTIAFLAFLLLSPLIRSSVNRVEKPMVAILQDNSESVGIHQADSAGYARIMEQLAEQLSRQYEVKTFSFGSVLEEGLQFSAKEKSTNISSALEAVANQFTNQNLGAVILATDGIFNEGSNPIYLDQQLRAPVYTIGLGDTTMRRDLQLSTIYYNRTVFIGDYFPIKAEWDARFCPGEKATVSVKEMLRGSEKVLQEKEIQIQSNDDHGSADFFVQAGEPGMKHYRISTTVLKEEASVANNVKDIFFEIIEKKEKILLLALAPHPDISALRQTIEQGRNYEVELKLGGEFSGKLDAYSLVILHQLPATGAPVQNLLSQIRNQNKSVLFILGAQTNVNLLNQAQNMVVVSGNNQATTEIQPVPAAEFSLFKLPETVSQNLGLFPPLISPFGEYKTAAGAVTLFYQKIGKVTTQYPLVVFQQDLNGRAGLIAGEGLWRWRLWDHLRNKNSESFDALISSMVQYLAVKADERQFRVRLEKELKSSATRIHSENEPIQFQAELLNESNELITDPDVQLEIRDESGKEFPFVFSKSGNYYVLDAGYFPQGNFTYTARTTYNRRDFVASGTFSVTPLRLEFINTRADHRLLNMLSAQTGGRLFYPSQWQELVSALQAGEKMKPVMYSTTRTEPLINWRWILLPLLLLVTLEWWIRKFSGSY